MGKVIVFKQADGAATVVYPAPEALGIYGIEAIAQKDVPHGTPYGIVDAADIPDIESWSIPDDLLKDGVGAEWSTFVQPLGNV